MDFLLPVRRLEEDPAAPLPDDAWEHGVAPVAQLLAEGLDLGAATVVTGENGAGKSTLLEALAIAYGLNAEGGSTGARLRSRATESSLGEHLRLVRGLGASRKGFFVRAETLHGLLSYLESVGFAEGATLHERSHGESMLGLVEERSRIRGLWLFDEPESALSLAGSLRLISLLGELLEAGSQVVLCTHSPVLAALPGARLLEAGPWGLREAAYDELDLVRGWRAFLEAPRRFLEAD